MTELSFHKKGILFALTAMLCSAAFMVPWKLAATRGSAEDMVLILCLGAAVFSTISLYFRGGKQALLAKPSRLEWGLSALFALFTIAGNQASAMAIHYLSPAVVTTIMRSEVVFITLMAWGFLGERVNLRFWAGVLLVMAGFYWMQPQMQGAQQWWHGALLAVLASLIFAVMAVMTRARIHQIDPSRVNGLRLWLSVLSWGFIYRKFPDVQQWSAPFVGLVLIAALLGPGLGRLAFMFSSRYLEARMTAMLISSSPVMALVLAWLMIDDIPSSTEVWGGAIIVLGTAVSLYQRRQNPTVASDHKLAARER